MVWALKALFSVYASVDIRADLKHIRTSLYETI